MGGWGSEQRLSELLAVILQGLYVPEGSEYTTGQSPGPGGLGIESVVHRVASKPEMLHRWSPSVWPLNSCLNMSFKHCSCCTWDLFKLGVNRRTGAEVIQLTKSLIY